MDFRKDVLEGGIQVVHITDYDDCERCMGKYAMTYDIANDKLIGELDPTRSAVHTDAIRRVKRLIMLGVL